MKDIRRLSGAVNKKMDGKSAFQFAIFAFYTVFENSEFKKKTTSEAINDLYEKLKNRFDAERGEATVLDRFIKPTKYQNFSGMMWGGGCILFAAP